MASSIRVEGRFNNYQHILDVSVVGQDRGANTSRLRYNYFLVRLVSAGAGSWSALNNRTFGVSINGVPNSTTANFDFRFDREISFVSGEITVTHNADGSLSVPVSFNFSGHSTAMPEASGSGTLVLDTIPRAGTISSITPSPQNVGSPVSITFTKNSGSHTQRLVWAAAGTSGVIGENVSPPVSWTPPSAPLGSSAWVAFAVTLETYSGATLIGRSQRDIVVRQVAAPSPATLGTATPYDMRFRRTEMSGSNWLVREAIPFAKAAITDTFSATATCQLEVPVAAYATSLENAVITAEVYDGSQWIDTELRFVLSRVERDPSQTDDIVKYTGTSYVDFLLSKNMTNFEQDFANTNPGVVMRRVIDTAKTRGWGPRLECDFSTAVTSVGTGWAVNDIGLDINNDMPALQILEGLVKDVQAEYRTEYRDNKAWLKLLNPGTGSDWTTPSSNVVNLATGALYKTSDRAPVRKDYGQLLTRVRVSGKESRRTRENAAAVNPLFGHLEGAVSATDVTSSRQLDRLGDAALRNQSTPVVEKTFSYNLSSSQAASAVAPYRTFRPGDWVLAPGDNGPERSRVAQIGLEHDGSAVKATVTVGEMIPSGIAATARKLTQQSSGAIPGGSLRAPAELTSAIPAAPTGVAVAGDGFWDNAGKAQANALVTWNRVTSSLAGTNISVDLYEVWTRPELGNPWVLAGVSETTEFVFGPRDINTTADFYVRARSRNGVYGDISDIVSVTMPLPDEDVAQPSSPALLADQTGTVRVTWNGLIGGSTPPPYFAYVRAEISASPSGPWLPAGAQLRTAGDIIVSSVGEGTWYFRLVGYDTLDQAGVPSASNSVEVVLVVADTRKPKAPVISAVTSYGYWNGPNPESGVELTWSAVTEAADDNSPIDIEVYEVWGRLTSDTNIQFLGRTEETTLKVQPLAPIGSSWTFAIRAVAANLQTGALSTTSAVTLVGPSMSIAAPGAPTLSSAYGLINVGWDGLLGGVVPTPPFRYVFAEMSTTEAGTYSPAGTAMTRDSRSISIAGVSAGQTRWVRLRAVDALGNITAASDAASVVVAAVDLGDLDQSVADAIEAAQDAANAAAVDAGTALDAALAAEYAATNIDAGNIVTGTLSADRVGARTIVAEKLLLSGNLSNLLQDPSFDAASTAIWSEENAGVVKTASNTRTGGRALSMTTTGSAYDASIYSAAIPAEEDEEYVFGGWVRILSGTGVGAAVHLELRHGPTDATSTGQVLVTDSPDPITTSYQYIQGVFEVPAGSKFIRPVVRITDTTASRTYLLDDMVLFKRASAELIVDGAITATKLAAESVTANALQAGSVVAGKIASGAVTAGTIEAASITANELAADSVEATKIKAGEVQVYHLSSEVGQELNISSNAAVNILVGGLDAVNARVDENGTAIQDISTVYRFENDAATISTPDSAYSLRLSPEAVGIFEAGTEVSRWDAGQLLVESLVVENVVLGNHKIEKYGTGTVVRAL